MSALLGYTHWRGVRTLDSGPRTRQTCGFFVPPINGREGMEIPEYHPPSITVLNLPTAPFFGDSAISETDRTLAMLACRVLFLPARLAVQS